jgi:hypothetical protein
MEHIAPLIQTALWVALLAVALWRFHKPIYDLLVAFQKRIESGSNIKAGPFEITDQLRPQDPLKQKEKVALELAEDLGAPLEAEQHVDLQTLPQSTIARQTKYFQAEDLVLRAIQAEYGATVSRQVTAGADIGFDGAFVSNGRLNIVEVKYLSGSIPNTLKLKGVVNRLVNAISSYGWKNTQIILAVVFENVEDTTRKTERLQNLFDQSHVPVVVKCYSFAELQQKFQITEETKNNG